MFAATTTDALIVADPGTLKKYPSSIPSCLDLIKAPTASSWSPDNTFLYISSSYTIHRYEPTSNFLKDIYTHSLPITCLVAKDKHKVIFASEDGIHTLECDPNPQISQTFDSHKTTVTSVSLSNDNSLLSSTSAGAVHVHNFNLGSHVVMRGLHSQGLVTSVFHPHTRTRLLVAAGRQLMVCDTTRPSGPVKTIPMNDSTSGDISAIACSPFSKTLVAVATSSGFVGLIDLEKEKALFRTLNLKTQLTTIGFSPEGAAIYFGTSTGKLLVLDLRALDKPPKSIALSNYDSRIETISVQRKAKPAEGTTKTPIGAATAAKKTPSEPVPPLRRAASTTSGPTSKSAAKSAPSPGRPRTVIGTTPISPVARRVPSAIKETGLNKTPLRGQPSKDPKKVLSPARDPLGNSGSGGNIAGQLDELAERRRGKTTTTPTKPPPKSPMNKLQSDKLSSRAASTKAESENPRRARTLPTSSSASILSSRKDSTNSIPTSTSDNHRLDAQTTKLSPVRRQRTVSSASHAASEALSVLSSTSRSTKSGTAPSSSSASRPSSSSSRPASSLTSRLSKETSPLRSKFAMPTNRSGISRTPSPDLPDIHVEPVTPVPMQKQKKKGMEILGLGTPEVDRWIQAGKEKERQRRAKDLMGKGKNVGFEDEPDKGARHDEDEDDGEEEMERTLSMQISPRRPMEASGSGSSEKWATSPPNPLSSASSGLGGIGVGGGGGGPVPSAQELLKTIVQDVLYDFQQETKAEMMGLHLDLLRMGRGWKTELRTLMDEYVGDLRDLREENQRLRLENERLRRGY